MRPNDDKSLRDGSTNDFDEPDRRRLDDDDVDAVDMFDSMQLMQLTRLVDAERENVQSMPERLQWIHR